MIDELKMIRKQLQDWDINYFNVCGINIRLDIYYSKEDICDITNKKNPKYNPNKVLYNVLRVFQICSVGLKGY